jgi:hypothetical protein
VARLFPAHPAARPPLPQRPPPHARLFPAHPAATLARPPLPQRPPPHTRRRRQIRTHASLWYRTAHAPQPFACARVWHRTARMPVYRPGNPTTAANSAPTPPAMTRNSRLPTPVEQPRRNPRVSCLRQPRNARVNRGTTLANPIPAVNATNTRTHARDSPQSQYPTRGPKQAADNRSHQACATSLPLQCAAGEEGRRRSSLPRRWIGTISAIAQPHRPRPRYDRLSNEVWFILS